MGAARGAIAGVTSPSGGAYPRLIPGLTRCNTIDRGADLGKAVFICGAVGGCALRTVLVGGIMPTGLATLPRSPICRRRHLVCFALRSPDPSPA